MTTYVRRQIVLPRDDSWRELLRFLVQSADADDPNLEFLAGLYSYSLHYNGITDKQADRIKGYAGKMLGEAQKKQRVARKFRARRETIAAGGDYAVTKH